MDLHGKVTKSWTKLSETARRGSTTLNLRDAVEWSVGDEVLITTTAFDYSQNEVNTIQALSDGGQTITLSNALQWTHEGEMLI